GDDKLVGDLFELLQETEIDMTLFFRRLADVPVGGAEAESSIPTRDPAGAADLAEALREAFYDGVAFSAGGGAALVRWLSRFMCGAREEGLPEPLRRERMNRVTRKYVFRNYLAQQAIDALEAGDTSVMERLTRVLQRPYEDQPSEGDLAGRRPEW